MSTLTPREIRLPHQESIKTVYFQTLNFFLSRGFLKVPPIKKHASIRIKPNFLSRRALFRPVYHPGLSLCPASLFDNACHVFLQGQIPGTCATRGEHRISPGRGTPCKVKPLTIRPDRISWRKEGFPVLFRAVPGLFRMMWSQECRQGQCLFLYRALFHGQKLLGMWQAYCGAGHFSCIIPANRSTSSFAKKDGGDTPTPAPATAWPSEFP